MKIRARLALQFTVIVAAILILFSGAIYYFFSTYRKSDYRHRLKDRALTAAKLLISVKEIDYNLLRIIDRNSIQPMVKENVIIYNDADNMIYSNTDTLVTAVNGKLLMDIRKEKEIYFSEGEREATGIEYRYMGKKYVLIASAWDKYGLEKLRFLRLLLLSGLPFCIAITLFAGWFYSNQALMPISNVIRKVDEITASKLNLRVDEGNKKDEIALLAITFNKMLDRLEDAFNAQKSFVSNASHEFRTPLTSISGQIEVSLLKERNIEEYKKILVSVLDDIRNLNKLSNGLLDLAFASADVSDMVLENVRVDEVLFHARTELLAMNKPYDVNITFIEFPDEENKISIFGNERLLKTAFMNLMDNACKYSGNHRANVQFSARGGYINIRFTDNGIGISESDVKHIFQPFYRAGNARHQAGHGLGLSLTERIVHLHKGTILIDSRLNEGTTLNVSLPSLASSFN